MIKDDKNIKEKIKKHGIKAIEKIERKIIKEDYKKYRKDIALKKINDKIV